DAGADGRVLGTPSGGNVAYAPADVITGAFALLDMAHRHAVDDATFAAAAQTAAIKSIDYVFARGRDQATGVFFTSLVTSADPGHDAVAPSQPGRPDDALLADVQAQIALALTRAQELAVMQNSGLSMEVRAYPFSMRASTVVDASNKAGSSLWDGFDKAD